MKTFKKINDYQYLTEAKCYQYGNRFFNLIFLAAACISFISCGDSDSGKNSEVKAGDPTWGYMVCKTSNSGSGTTYSLGCKNPMTDVVLIWNPSTKDACNKASGKKRTRCST